MSTTDADRFIAALHRLEDEEDVEGLVELFTDDAELDTATATADLRGKDGARELWSEDRGMFASVHSEFRNVIVDGDHAALEWRRDATGHDGNAFSYTGVTILEFADGHVRRFSGFFDPRQLASDVES